MSKPIDYAELEHESLEKALRSICRRDDAIEMEKLLRAQNTSSESEITHSKTALEYAIEVDAVKIFSWMLGKDSGKFGASKTTRLWGGQIPVHHCALITIGGGHDKCAPKCLAHIISIDPNCAARADEEGRTAMDWAAMNSGVKSFKPLFHAALRARESGRLSANKFKLLISKSLFMGLETATDPKAMLQKLDMCKLAGLDWRDLRTPNGNSPLGALFSSAVSYSASPDTVGLALLAAGADPMAPFVQEPGPYDKKKPSEPQPCAFFALSARKSMWSDRPKLVAAITNKLSDDDFMAAMNQGLAKLSMEIMKLFLHNDRTADDDAGSAILGRYLALTEARAISASANQPSTTITSKKTSI